MKVAGACGGAAFVAACTTALVFNAIKTTISKFRNRLKFLDCITIILSEFRPLGDGSVCWVQVEEF
jgi:hypothetical protein